MSVENLKLKGNQDGNENEIGIKNEEEQKRQNMTLQDKILTSESYEFKRRIASLTFPL